MKELRDLELILRSHTPILIIESLEETRAVQLFTRLGMQLNGLLFQWTVTEGLRRLGGNFGPQGFTAEPVEVLKHVKAVPKPGYYLLLDYHPFLGNPRHVRLIKEIALGYDAVPRTLIFLSYSFDIPPEIRHLCARFELHLPDLAGIRRLISQETDRWQTRHRRNVRIDGTAMELLASNLIGVTASDALRLIKGALEDDAAITLSDIDEVKQAKYELISQEGAISFEYDTTGFSEVAGLHQLKHWLSQRSKAFQSNEGGLDRPKGIMLLGVQGGGKSLSAKAVAGSFGVPLLRLDFGALYNKYIGETEKNLRKALKTASTMAPCVLWMDEVEKGISTGAFDAGLSQRVLGTLLTWMAENDRQVFIVATSNDISKLPPELIRKGRLDEIFFVDLPADDARGAIFEIHLRKRKQVPGRFDLELLSQASEGYTGAEIEQVVVSALYAAQAQDSELSDELLLDELARTRPLSTVMAEQVQGLRHWAEGRTVSAN